MQENRILFVLPVIGHPRDSKRISMLISSGFNIDAVAFDRKRSSSRYPHCNVSILSQISDGKYFKRILALIFSIKKIRDKLNNVTIIYASGPDMAMISLIASYGLKIPVILEVGDIREIQTDQGIKGRIYRIIDKYIVNSCSLIIVTSSAYYHEYYRKWLNINKEYLVIENKIENYTQKYKNEEIDVNKKTEKDIYNSIIIGYFGVLRCEKTMEILLRIAINNPEKYKILIAGQISVNKIYLEKINQIKNIQFIGEYKSPEDLFKIYNSVDLVWACYPFPDYNSYNWRWAKTNRFYESCYFKKPMIGLYESGDSNDITKYKIGKLIRNNDVNDIVKQVESISYSDIERWKEKINDVPVEKYVYTNEGDIISKTLITIIQRKIK